MVFFLRLSAGYSILSDEGEVAQSPLTHANAENRQSHLVSDRHRKQSESLTFTPLDDRWEVKGWSFVYIERQEAAGRKGDGTKGEDEN